MPIRLSLEGSLPSMTLLDYRMLQMQDKKTYQSVNSKRGWNLLYLIREKSTPPMSSCCYKSIVPPILIQIMFSNTRYHLPVQYKRGCNYYCSLSWPQNLIKKKSGERRLLSVVPLKMRNWWVKHDFDSVLCIYEDFTKACVPEHSRNQESSLKSCPLWTFPQAMLLMLACCPRFISSGFSVHSFGFFPFWSFPLLSALFSECIFWHPWEALRGMFILFARGF